MMQRWEYHCLSGVYVSELPDILSRLGIQGWELVSADLYHGHYVLKRPIEYEGSRA